MGGNELKNACAARINKSPQIIVSAYWCEVRTSNVKWSMAMLVLHKTAFPRRLMSSSATGLRRGTAFLGTAPDLVRLFSGFRIPRSSAIWKSVLSEGPERSG